MMEKIGSLITFVKMLVVNGRRSQEGERCRRGRTWWAIHDLNLIGYPLSSSQLFRRISKLESFSTSSMRIRLRRWSPLQEGIRKEEGLYMCRILSCLLQNLIRFSLVSKKCLSTYQGFKGLLRAPMVVDESRSSGGCSLMVQQGV